MIDSELDNVQEDFKFKVNPYLLIQLGEELITNKNQAILELIKNSYDADANWCNVEVDTNYEGFFSFKTNTFTEDKKLIEDFQHCIKLKKENELIYDQPQIIFKVKGKITFSDDGTGMGMDDIRDGWLNISGSSKRKLKKLKKKTPIFKREYIGDKGLGRVSSMKLGSILKIQSWKDTQEGIEATINWSQARYIDSLDNFKVDINALSASTVNGTTLEIYNLSDFSQWQESLYQTKVQLSLSSMLALQNNNNFSVAFSIDGDSVDLRKLNKELLNTAVCKFSYKFCKDHLFCIGKVKLNFYKGTKLLEKERFKKYIESDNAERFKQYLKNYKLISDYRLIFPKRGDWYIIFKMRVPIDEIFSSQALDEEKIDHPGNFDAYINYFFFNTKTEINPENSSTINVNAFLKEMIGVGVYRDMFRIVSGKYDWMGIGKEQLAGKGFYSLRASNVVGRINLDVYENLGLKEKSDREGLIENEALNGFLLITKRMLKFANDFLNNTRRAASSFKSDQEKFNQGKKLDYDAQNALSEISDLFNKTIDSSPQILESFKSVNLNISKSIETGSVLSNSSNIMEVKTLASKSLNNLKKVKVSIEDLASKQQDILDDFVENKYSVNKVVEDFEMIERQISEMYDHIAIGISAQSLAHEINSITSYIIRRINQLNKRLELFDNSEKLVEIIWDVKSNVNSIQKQVSLLSPMLRSHRELKGVISVKKAIEDYFFTMQRKFDKEKISFVIDIVEDINIRFNKGKLLQIFENLANNSIYWLGHYQKKIKKKEIHIKLNRNILVFSDNGHGIEPNKAKKIFELFVTYRTNGGVGLGLFIVNQILTDYGCSIRLLNTKNKFGNYYCFEIDLGGAFVTQ